VRAASIPYGGILRIEKHPHYRGIAKSTITPCAGFAGLWKFRSQSKSGFRKRSKRELCALVWDGLGCGIGDSGKMRGDVDRRFTQRVLAAPAAIRFLEES